jgi:NADH:ubiquinone oxidoreductase subunit E
MLVFEQESLIREIGELCDKLGRKRASLLAILHAYQGTHACIPDFAMQEIAHQLDIHPVEVYSVVSFYSFFSTEEKGHFILRLCRTISCDMLNKDQVARQLEQELGISFGETTPDGHFTLEWTNCIGMCDMGPAMMVNNQIFTKVTPTRVHEILEICRRIWGLYPENDDLAVMKLAGAMAVKADKEA